MKAGKWLAAALMFCMLLSLTTMGVLAGAETDLSAAASGSAQEQAEVRGLQAGREGSASFSLISSEDPISITGPGVTRVFCTLNELTLGPIGTGGKSIDAASVRFAFFASYEDAEITDGKGHTLPIYVMENSEPCMTEWIEHDFVESEVPGGFTVSVYVYKSDWEACEPGIYTGPLVYCAVWTSADGEEMLEYRNLNVSAKVTDPDQAFSVTVEDTVGGTLTADKASAKAGETVTVTAAPAEGYSCGGIQVTGAEAQKADENVYTFTMPDSDVTVSGQWGMSWATLQARINSAADGETIVLYADCTAAAGDTVLTVRKSLTLDLNGHTLDRGLTKAATGGNAISVTGSGKLKIRDSAGGGKITGAFHDGSGGAILNNGTLTIEGGTFTKNTAKEAGAVYHASGAVLTITGGAFTDNKVTNWGGGAIVNYGTMTMSDGTISGNSVPMNGAGIWTSGTLTLTGGRIEDNILESDTGNGGGIYFKDGTLNISGNPVVIDNTKNDLHMLSGKTLLTPTSA